MNRLASLFVIVSLGGCASRSAIPAATAASAATGTPAQPVAANPSADKVVELRHFYLLSPGPSATLVVTRSDAVAVDR